MVVGHYGGPDQLRFVEEECSEPQAGEVRAKFEPVRLCGSADFKQSADFKADRSHAICSWEVKGLVTATKSSSLVNQQCKTTSASFQPLGGLRQASAL